MFRRGQQSSIPAGNTTGREYGAGQSGRGGVKLES